MLDHRLDICCKFSPIVPEIRQDSYLEHADDSRAASGFRGVVHTVRMIADTTSTNKTPEIEKKHVHGVYESIAPHFSSTRFAKWPKVAFFLDSLVPGSIIIDAGCGNGKYLGLNQKCFFVGCDISSSLISICARRDNEVLVADTLQLPYRAGFFDAAISIAVLHHLSTEDRRRKAVLELTRVVCRGGKVLITVWAVEQEDRTLLSKWTPLNAKYSEEWVGGSLNSRLPKSLSETSLQSIKEHGSDIAAFEQELPGFVKTGGEAFSQQNFNCESFENHKDTHKSDGCTDQIEQQEFFVPWHLPYHRAEIGGASAAIASGLARKDDKKAAIIYNRYYHVFAQGELERLVSSIQGIRILESFYDKSNWCVILERTCDTS